MKDTYEDNRQARLYAQDLALIYRQEKEKRKELAEAYQLLEQKNLELQQEKNQLMVYADDLNKLFQKQQQTVRQIKKANLETVLCLSVAAEYRDRDTADHINRMSTTSMQIARAMGWNEEDAEMMKHASPMHDIGKIGIEDAILFKPGRYTPEEFEIMKQHTIIGYLILKETESPLLQMAARIAHTHHEKYNGQGYPRGLKGDDIPIEGRIVAVADVYDALLSKRVYKPSFTKEKALKIMTEERNKHFDPEIFDAFMTLVD